MMNQAGAIASLTEEEFSQSAQISFDAFHKFLTSHLEEGDWCVFR